MALMFEYEPGMDLTQPWAFTVERNNLGYFFDNTGKLVQAGLNVARDRHYPLGFQNGAPLGQRTLLLDRSHSNWLQFSNAWGTAPWGQGSMQNITNNSGLSPDGINSNATLGIPNTTSTTQHAILQSVTITANENIAISCYVKAAGYTALQLQFDDNGPQTNLFRVSFDLATGTVGTMHQAVGTGATVLNWFIVPLANGWFWIGAWGVLGNSLTTGRFIVFVYDTIAHANAGTAYAGDGTSGILFWGAQTERNTTLAFAPSMLLPTTNSVPVSTVADKLSTPWPFPSSIPMWAYVNAYDLGGLAAATSRSVLTIMNESTLPAWLAVFNRNNSAPGASWESDNPYNGTVGNTNRNTVASSTTPVIFDRYEVFSRVFGDGSTRIEARKNGGASTTGGPIGPTAGIPYCGIRSPKLILGDALCAPAGPLCGIISVKIGADPNRITTLAQAAAV